VQPFGECRSVLLVEVRDHRRVAPPAHVVPAQRVAQLREVVELPVEDGRDVLAFVLHRLVARLGVDDDQPLVAEDAPAQRVRRAVVRPAVDHRRTHAIDRDRVGCAV
jgi:hypothetical protein